MNRKLRSWGKVGLTAFVAVLLLAAMGMAVAWAAGAEGQAMSHPRRPRGAEFRQATGTIVGTVSYSGVIPGTHLVWVGAFRGQEGPPLFAAHLDGPGSYTLTVEAGIYDIHAGMDADDSGGAPDPGIDPMGSYARNPVIVAAGATLTGVDIIRARSVRSRPDASPHQHG